MDRVANVGGRIGSDRTDTEETTSARSPSRHSSFFLLFLLHWISLGFIYNYSNGQFYRSEEYHVVLKLKHEYKSQTINTRKEEYNFAEECICKGCVVHSS